MNLDIAADNPFGDADGFTDFLGQHELVHRQINEFMLKKGLIPASYNLGSNPEDNPSWLLDHYQLHLNEFALLGLGADALPDISVVNFKDEEQYSDWMYVHAQIHDQVNQALGITS